MPSLPAKDTSLNEGAPETGDPQAPRDTAPPDPARAETLARFNEAGVRNAQANWLDGINALLYAPGTGYLQQRGAAALGGYAPAQQAMGKLTQQAQDSLADDHQRGLFAQATAPLLDAIQTRIHQHAQTQGRVYDADASRARGLAARDLAVNAWNPAPGADNGNYRQCAAILHNELENQFRHAWGEPEAGDNQPLWDHFLQHGPNGDDGMASLTTGVVNRLLANDQPHEAQAFLDQVQHTLPAPTLDKLDQFVTAAVDQHAGSQAALQAQAAGNDAAAQQQKLDTLRDDGHISDEAHAIATHKIQADQAAKAAAQQQSDAQTLQKVWDLKNANPNAALTDLGSADYAYLKSRGLDGNALAILQSHPATDDPGLFNELHRMAAQDPVQFGKENLLAHSGKLSRAHMQILLDLQDAVNKQDPQAIQAGKRIDMTVNALTGGTQSGGTDDDPAAPGADIHAKQDPAHELEAGLRDHLIAAQLNDPKLTLEDLHAAGAYFLKDWPLYGDGYGARTDAQQVQNGYLPSPDILQKASAGDQRQPTLTLGEFNGFVRLVKTIANRKVLENGQKRGVTSEERKQVEDMQNRLGIEETGKYDNATQHALQAAFIDMLRPIAEDEEKKHGIPAAVIIAQAITESGYGFHTPTDIKTGQGSSNFFGIKPDKEGQPFVNAWTKEYNKKTKKFDKVVQPFAMYDNAEGSIREHSAFLLRNSGRYKSLFATSDPQEWADGLQAAGYAGDNPTYADGLKKVMRRWNLIK